MEKGCLDVDVECNNDVLPFLPDWVAQESVLIARSDLSSYLQNYSPAFAKGSRKKGESSQVLEAEVNSGSRSWLIGEEGRIAIFCGRICHVQNKTWA
jgi:hypothetical protein